MEKNVECECFAIRFFLYEITYFENYSNGIVNINRKCCSMQVYFVEVCRRTVEMITMYCVSITPVSSVVPILVNNIFLTLAVNISKILVIYFHYSIHALRIKMYFKEDYKCQINFVQTLVFYSVNYQSRFDTGWTLHIYCWKKVGFVVQTLVFYSRLPGLNRHWIDLVHPLSENYFFHSPKKVGPVVHPTLHKR